MLRKQTFMLATLLASLPASALAAPGQCRINVTPDVQVSKGRSVYSEKYKQWAGFFRETRVDVNPLNPKNLLASASYEPGELNGQGKADERGRISVLFRSIDGGKSWHEVHFRPVIKNAFEGDPVVFFDRDGNAYYQDTYSVTGVREGNAIYRSKDGGKSWTEIGYYEFVDQVLWTANPKSDPRASRIFGVGMNSDPIPGEKDKHDYKLVLITPGADGKFALRDVATGVEIADLLGVKDYIGFNATHFPFVSRTGKLFMTMENWSKDQPMDGKRHKLELHKRWMLVSDDHGLTNSKPRLIAKADGSDLVSGLGTYRPAFAIDNGTGPFSNRIYTAFMDAKSIDGPWAFYMSHSDDEGQTWSEPVKIQDQPDLKEDYGSRDTAYPAIAVNRQGVVMVSWFWTGQGPDKVDAKGEKKPTYLVRRMMTASLDGGQTFLPVTPLSSKTAGGTAGDYIGIASDSNGRLNALWTDDRLGPQHMFYASAIVTCNGKPARAQQASR